MSDKLREAADYAIRRLQSDIDSGSRPDQWSMEDIVRGLRSALAADDAEKIAQAAEQSVAFQYLREQVAQQMAPIYEAFGSGVPSADDAAQGTMREAFDAWCRRNGYPIEYTPDAECGVEGGPIYSDPRTHAAWWAYREGRAALAAATPEPIYAKSVVRRLATQMGWKPPGAAAPQSAEPAAWANNANIASAAVSRQRGGPFDQHTWSEGRTDYHSTPLYLHSAPTEDDRLDAQRLDWVFSHWPNGIHVECCATGGPTVHGLVPTVTIFYGPQEWKAPSLRAAIDAAMSAQAGGKEQGS